MKKLYTLICAGLLISLASSAQYTGGTYTAQLPGLWHVTSGPTIWTGNTEPPQNCNNCLIQLFPTGGGTIVLNTQVLLRGGSTIVLGANTVLQIMPSGGNSFDGTTPPLGNYIIVQNDGTNNNINLPGSASIDASDPSLSNYDGIFTAAQDASQLGTNHYTLTKQMGGSTGQVFVDNTETVAGPAIIGTTLNGPNFISSTGLGTLPIILSSFTAVLNQDVVNLAWTTTSEKNADHIAILRSADAGAHWSVIGNVAAKNNTSTPTNYSFADNKPLTGASEYRLQLVDKDGKYTYSEVRTIRNSLVSAASVFPNPAHNLVNVTLGSGANGNTVIRLMNQNGQLMQLKNVTNAAGMTVALPVSGYAEGTYFIVVGNSDGTTQVSKVMITK